MDLAILDFFRRVRGFFPRALRLLSSDCIFNQSINASTCGDRFTRNLYRLQLVFFFHPKKLKDSVQSNVFLNGVRVQFSEQVKYLRVLPVV